MKTLATPPPTRRPEPGPPPPPETPATASPRRRPSRASGPARLFQAGDLVWAKVRNQPWWPGRVSLDLSPPSNPAAAGDPGHRVLVSLFGAGGEPAWYAPNQLKPFKEEFGRMARQSGSGSFVAAVEDSLDWVRRCLESEMSCHCVPSSKRVRSGRVPVSNYSPEEFLDRLAVAACDFSVTDGLEDTMLQSWASAFFGRKDGSVHEVLSKECVVEKPEQGEGAGAVRKVKGPEVSEGESSHRKKKRSMAELIGATEANTGKEEKAVNLDKKHKGQMVAGDGIGVAAEQGTSISRRERRKSKYLSPPYTFLSGHSKSSSAVTDEKVVMPDKDVEAWDEVIHKEEDERNNSSPGHAGPPANEILSQFRSAATDPLHLKWDHSAETIMGFLAKVRSSVCSGDPEGETYSKQLVGSDSSGREFLSNELNVETNGGAALSFGQHGNTSEPGKYRQRRRKMRMEQGATDDTSVSLLDALVDGLEGEAGRKRRKAQVGGIDRIEIDLGHNHADGSEDGKLRQKMTKKINVKANGKTPMDLVHATNNSSRLGKSEQRKKSKEELSIGLGAGWSRQKRTKREGTIPSQPLIDYIRENLKRMISTVRESPLPEKDAALDKGLKPEVREILVGEMQSLLSKIDKLLT